MAGFWQLLRYWIGHRKIRLGLGGTSLAAVVLTALSMPGPQPVTIAPPTPAGFVVHPTPPGASATAGKPRFTQRPPVVKAGSRPPVLSDDGIPSVALAAYEHAAALLAISDPTCNLSWEDLAGIGRVESDNGQTWGSGARVTLNGTLFPPILGPILDGQDGMPAIATTDGGVLEHGGQWARAVGPMQFLPATWFAYEQDGNGDGVDDPQNFYDAALTAGVYLCKNGGDIGTQAGLTNGIYAYNHSSSYVSIVEQWVGFYTEEGAKALLTAGEGLIPVGNPSQTITLNTVPIGASEPGSVPLAAAAVTSDDSGTFSLTMQAYMSSTEVARGSASVDFATKQAAMTLDLTSVGTVDVRVLGATVYVALPASLAADTGVKQGKWVKLTSGMLGAMPALIGRGLGVLSYDLVWVIAQFEGGTPQLIVEGTGSINGLSATDYFGSFNLGLAAQVVPAAGTDLGRAADLLNGAKVGVDAWVDDTGHLRSVVLFLPRLPGTGTASQVTVDLSFYGYGSKVTITDPGSTTTTTTSSTTTSTTPSSTTPTSSTEPTTTTAASTTSSSSSTTSTSTTSTIAGTTTSTTGNTGTGTTFPGNSGTSGAT